MGNCGARRRRGTLNNRQAKLHCQLCVVPLLRLRYTPAPKVSGTLTQALPPMRVFFPPTQAMRPGLKQATKTTKKITTEIRRGAEVRRPGSSAEVAQAGLPTREELSKKSVKELKVEATKLRLRPGSMNKQALVDAIHERLAGSNPEQDASEAVFSA
jgi:hypothetical protein